ncbi:tetratricopeptide repeat protein [Bacillus velezensis]|uniref:Tetratricopeptide repeat protein n=1 Tax=Bacillus velezensis TaxID=492670 RepID=A0ABC8D0T1_BACVE|nr:MULTISPECIES: Rap family tetratricopeptide repeat protein [Bacillus amyloliquefaciens group]AVI27171.1 tetratricopeptide repeat protein [Bacillus velezensis]AWX70820.1 tetratricopeptide repeat protein [Bacillus velezensis]MDK2559374.1 tetratricopeptide repeat protein [Bacillus amyloliquefaciens]UUI53165.1 tetratricopeptide repeat protein [Bacillus velezensis]WPB70830.1 Rap family tetratricopeptide repeat protein [Bacillus velezensis]
MGDVLNKDKIPYDLVTKKLNDWYTHIKNDHLDQAGRIKKEVEKDLKNMEESKDVLLYYQLLEFRHELLVNYMNSEKTEELNSSYLAMKRLEDQGNVTGMLEYYFHFFMGMYEFRRKKLTAAITSYRKAESKLTEIDDEIEKAEFFFKVAYVYYYMKQTYFSLNYAYRALEIYTKYDDYFIQRIRCQFILGGNFIDSLEYEKALEIFMESLKIAEEIQVDYLIGMAHINIGICFDELKNYGSAASHLEKALYLLEVGTHSFVAKTLFILTHVKIKQGDKDSADIYFQKGREFVKKTNDAEYTAKFKILEGLYFSNGEYDLISDAFAYFDSMKMYADLENYAVEVARFFYQMQDFQRSSEYYMLSVEAKNKIKKGEIINENQSSYLGSSGVN